MAHRRDYRCARAAPWMRATAPIAAPVFRWNHNGVMRAGAEGLARLLKAKLIDAY